MNSKPNLKTKAIVFPIFVAAATLLLQIISFVTTWQGAAVYLESIFPFASLLFALAVQSTVWFFSNSLRQGIRPLKVFAMCIAVCCSTYFSYIGICNAVNPVAAYLQDTYTGIRTELTAMADSRISDNQAAVSQSIAAVSSRINAASGGLAAERDRLDRLEEELSALSNTRTASMRAPSPSQYENYEDYVTAYQAYVAGSGLAGQTESQSRSAQLLSSYGFASMEEYLERESAVTALLSSLPQADAPVSDSEALTETIRAAMGGSTPLPDDAAAQLQSLYHLYEVSEGSAGLVSQADADILPLKELLRLIEESCRYRADGPMPDHTALAAQYPAGSASHLMELKASMDAEVSEQLLQLKLLLPDTESQTLSASGYHIVDIYLLPIRYLLSDTLAPSAIYCLLLAALIDGLTLILALSLLARKPLWHRQYLCSPDDKEWEVQAASCLARYGSPEEVLADFLSLFTLCSNVEKHCGYVLSADLSSVQPYQPFIALLCQTGMAEVTGEKALLKPAFLYWANAGNLSGNITDYLSEELTGNIKGEAYE